MTSQQPPTSPSMSGDQPPSYEAATRQTHHVSRNGISPSRRRSMEDEQRPLPPGWIRQYDPASQHQFFVDTNANPPRSIWHHPEDDEQYLSTLSADERERLKRLHRSLSLADIEAESSDDDASSVAGNHGGSSKAKPKAPAAAGGAGGGSSSGQRPSMLDADNEVHGIHRFGRKMKDKVTGTTHQQRMQERSRRAEEERKAYELHMKARQAMIRAMETGEPQFLCKDRNGDDLYIKPPPTYNQGMGTSSYGYTPYAYGPGRVVYSAPSYPYARPYGFGYGGGYGFPLLGGMLGGAMLGSMLF